MGASAREDEIRKMNKNESIRLAGIKAFLSYSETYINLIRQDYLKFYFFRDFSRKCSNIHEKLVNFKSFDNLNTR